MKNLSKLTALMATTLLLSFVACEKEGPEGPAGPAGPQGEQGVVGNKGDAGTANVFYSEWAAAEFTAVGSNYTVSISAPALTQEVLDHGHVEIYFRFKVGTDSYIIQNVTSASTWNWTRLFPEIIKLYFGADFSDPEVYAFRYVIIPGGVAASARADGLDLSNFSAVARTFNIPE